MSWELRIAVARIGKRKKKNRTGEEGQGNQTLRLSRDVVMPLTNVKL